MSTAPRSLIAFALVSACVQDSELVRLGDDSHDAGLADSTPAETTGDAADPSGNYPDPAVLRCGELPPEVPEIAELRSSWAVRAVPGATWAGEAVAPGSVLLRLSEGVWRSCDSTDLSNPLPPDASSSTGGGAHPPPASIELLLAPEQLTEGVQPLSELRGGPGLHDATLANATLELIRVDDDCVVGVLRGLETQDGEPFLEGGFVAQTCQLQCLPSHHRC